MSDIFTAERLNSSPLKFSYSITSEVSIDTTVSGDSRQNASVSIVYGSMTLWSGTMTQFDPEIKTPFEIKAGSITIEEGGTFTLTIPTSLQNGSVAANLMIKSSTSTVPFNALVASWPLSSAS